MGLFDSIGDIFKTRSTYGLNKILPGAPDQENGPDYSSAFNDYDKQREAQAADAARFRSSIPTLNQQAGTIQGEEGRQGLARKLTDIKRSASSRGLLYSGIKQGADQEVASSTASDLANKSYSTNKSLENQAQKMENSAIESGMKGLEAKQQAAQQSYQMALQRRQAQQQGQAGLLGGVGSLAGAALGGQMKG